MPTVTATVMGLAPDLTIVDLGPMPIVTVTEGTMSTGMTIPTQMMTMKNNRMRK
jgi:hypothetical protein